MVGVIAEPKMGWYAYARRGVEVAGPAFGFFVDDVYGYVCVVGG
jgi:hypothetical protein